MTEEPVYECQHCGKTLERGEQGKYTYCRDCRLMWDSAFMTGFRHAQGLLMVGSIIEMKQMMDRVAPYMVNDME